MKRSVSGEAWKRTFYTSFRNGEGCIVTWYQPFCSQMRLHFFGKMMTKAARKRRACNPRPALLISTSSNLSLRWSEQCLQMWLRWLSPITAPHGPHPSLTLWSPGSQEMSGHVLFWLLSSWDFLIVKNLVFHKFLFTINGLILFYPLKWMFFR